MIFIKFVTIKYLLINIINQIIHYLYSITLKQIINLIIHYLYIILLIINTIMKFLIPSLFLFFYLIGA